MKSFEHQKDDRRVYYCVNMVSMIPGVTNKAAAGNEGVEKVGVSGQKRLVGAGGTGVWWGQAGNASGWGRRIPGGGWATRSRLASRKR